MPPIHALSQRRAALEQEWARWAPVHAVPAGQTVLRSEVVQSWRRSLPTVDPGRPAAPADDGELGARWSHSPLRAPSPSWPTNCAASQTIPDSSPPSPTNAAPSCGRAAGA